MPRPCCMRRINFMPGVQYFKPAGIPLRELKENTVKLDELEALRLADLEGLYQEKAAKRMRISRPTFARIVEEARRKTADALINGKALRLEGGSVIKENSRHGMGQGPCGCGQHRDMQTKTGAASSIRHRHHRGGNIITVSNATVGKSNNDRGRI